MGKQIAMDATGDTEHKFNPADAVALADAEKRFTELTRAGFNAPRKWWRDTAPAPVATALADSSSRGHGITIA